MAAGSFSLYYKDSNDTRVACAGVRYRIIRQPDSFQVADGTTNDSGATRSVSPDGDGVQSFFGTQPWGLHNSTPGIRPSPLLPVDIVRYRLQVWNPVIKDWVDPDLHPSQIHRDLEVQRDSEIEPVDDGEATDVLREVVIVSKQLRVVPSFNVQLRLKSGNKPIPDAPYIAYRIDKNGREIVASDVTGRAIRGNTKKDGSTGKIQCVDHLIFRFDGPGPGTTQVTQRVAPMPPGVTPQLYTLDVKSISAMTEPNDGAVGEVSGKISAPAVLNAETEELILLEPKVWQEFEELSGRVESTFAGVHIARSNLNSALQGRTPEEIKAAEEALGLAEDRVAKMLNEEFPKKADLQELITFETYDKGRTTGNGGFKDRVGLRRRYIPKAKYDDLKRRRIKNIPVKIDLKVKGKVTAGPVSVSVRASHDPLSKQNFDRDAFFKSLSKIIAEAKIKVATWKTDPWVLDIIDAGGNQFSRAVEHSKSFSTETQAQWLRCVAGAGASSQLNWDPSKGRVGASLQGSAQAKLVLFESRYVMSYAVPSAKGWQMHFAGEDLGAIVFVLACEFYGFVGAKASVTGSVGVSIKSGKAQIKALARDRNDSLAESYDRKSGLPRATLDNKRVVPGSLNEALPKENDINGMKVQAEAFAGAEAGLSPSGELKWLPPEQREPVSFAKLTVDIAGSAGAGASGQLYIYYANGKFRIKASARLCWGLGAKGALDYEVDAGGVMEFVKWVYYQLAHAGFKVLVYIAEDAFDALSRILYVAIVEGFGLQDTSVDRLFRESKDAIDRAFYEVNLSIERAEKRIEMARNVNKKPDWLIYATPETRGMLLYQLTRHDWAAHGRDLPTMDVSWAYGVEVHYLDQHKQAVLAIFQCVRTVSEWNNALQHMTADGSKRDAGKAEGDVLRLLNYGADLVGNLKGEVFDPLNTGKTPGRGDNKYIDQYMVHRAKLLGRYPKGYEVATLGLMDATQLALLDGQDSPMFARLDPGASWLEDDERRLMLALQDNVSEDDGTRMA